MRPRAKQPLAVLLALGFLLAAAPASAQTTLVTGTVADSADGTPLPGVAVFATRLSPDSARTGTVSDVDGAFRLSLPAGEYRLRLTYIGYEPLERTVTARGERLDLGPLALRQDVIALRETVVEAVQERVTLRGDTTAYNADAFKVNRDATAEDLVSKMPGITVEQGTVQAQGEEVRRVLVDGEEFLGDDATAALRNLPAEIIQEVQVYDRRSDQARFTGFDDGNEEKTINVVTRRGMQNGQFGRVFGGYGTDARYLAGGTVNVFDGARRISVIGLANNVNQQNFASEDLLGALNAATGGRGGQGGGGRRGGGGGGRGGNASDYRIGEQGGINRTNALGINYTDRWKGDVRVNGSYFFNHTGNDTDALLEREYFGAGSAGQLYSENEEAENRNANHRVNFRLEVPFSERTELTFTPRLSLQTNGAESALLGFSSLQAGVPLSRTSNAYRSDNLGYNTSANVLLRHRLPKRGRTVSMNLGVNLDGRHGDTDQDVVSTFFEGGLPDSTDAFSRRSENDRWGRTFSANLSYTEPLGERGMLQLSYAPSVSQNATDQDAFRRDEGTGDFTLRDSAYTNVFDRYNLRQRGGVSYRYRREGLNASLGLDVQNEQLGYEQAAPNVFEVNRSFLSVLPSANLRYEVSEETNLNLSYRASTDAPSVNQLRNFIDDTNPLLISTGNPGLRPSYAHNVNVRYRSTKPTAGRVFTAFANLSVAQDYLATAAVLAGRDTMRVRGVTLRPGAQLTYPVNLDGYWSARSFLSYGLPVPLLKSNANLNGGLSFNRTPSLINEVANQADALRLNGRLSLGSNVSERVDFGLSYGVSYTTVWNTSSAAQDDAYFQHRTGARIHLEPTSRLILESDFNYAFYTGLSQAVDPTVALWNVAVGYRFLPGDAAEVRLTVTDLLNQNTSVNRVVTGLYVEDNQTEALGRYFMLNLIYRLRHFRM